MEQRHLTGLSRPSVYRLMKDGTFPNSIDLGNVPLLGSMMKFMNGLTKKSITLAITTQRKLIDSEHGMPESLFAVACHTMTITPAGAVAINYH